MSATGTPIDTAVGDDQLSRVARLSPRERELLGLLAHGHRASAIAARLVVPPAAVRCQIEAILRKLDVPTQVEAAALHRVRWR